MNMLDLVPSVAARIDFMSNPIRNGAGVGSAGSVQVSLIAMVGRMSLTLSCVEKDAVLAKQLTGWCGEVDSARTRR